MAQPILVTGAAGFIGFHLAQALLTRGETVVGVDNLNPYYDVGLKRARLTALTRHPGYDARTLDVADSQAVAALFSEVSPRRVVHLAAQAGVRYSLENPAAYGRSNLSGFLNILEGCRATDCRHLVFASTSSAYGANGALPFSVRQAVSHPLTLYAATKIANEAMAHSYAHLFRIPMTGLRFFTVYGPWGRPDMAPMKFAEAILEGRPIDVFGQGRMRRDFTYVDDIVDGVIAALDRPPAVDPAWDSTRPDPSTSGAAPWRILNLGAGRPVELMDFIAHLETALGCKAELNFLPMQDGDVTATEADLTETRAALGYDPQVSVEEGVRRFAAWFVDYRAA